MIPYVEIIDKYTLKAFAIVEPKECWFELSYYNIGAFEIYCNATKNNLNNLQKGQYVRIPNKQYLWIITSVEYSTVANNARMISAKGYEAKWLLNKRIIQTPLELPNDLAQAVYNLVNYNMSIGASNDRRINGFMVEMSQQTVNIAATQATRGNLSTFVNELLKTYNFGSQVIFSNGTMYYKLLKGSDRSQTVKFSQSLDNLLSSRYYTSDDNLGSYALVVSKVEEVDYTKEYNKGGTGIDRSEVLVDSNLSTKYEDASGQEQETTPTSALYQGWQVEEGKKELTNHETIIEVDGQIDIINSMYEFGVDFDLGDLVGVRDEYFNFSINERILKYTISQNADGYAEKCDFGE